MTKYNAVSHRHHKVSTSHGIKDRPDQHEALLAEGGGCSATSAAPLPNPVRRWPSVRGPY